MGGLYYKACCAKTCYKINSKTPIKLFRFPKDLKYSSIWATKASREDLLKFPNYLHRFYLCADHFTDDSFINSQRTKFKKGTTPIPTIFKIQYNYDHDENKEECSLCLKQISKEQIVSLNDAKSKRKLELVLPRKVWPPDEFPSHSCFQCSININQCFEIMTSFIAVKEQYKENKNSSTISPIKNINPTDVNIIFECQLCNDELSKEINVYNHEDVCEKIFKNSSKYLMCYICFEIFSDGKSLKEHTTEHKLNQTNQEACDKCGEKSDLTFSLLEYYLKNNRLDNLQCQLCRQQFEEETELNNHIKIHIDEDTKVRLCATCCENILQTFSVKIQILPKEKPPKKYTCPICGRKVKSNVTLQCHIGTHTGEKRPISCELCGKRFITAEQYRTHIRAHTNERPYKCSQCDGTFRNYATLKQHMLTHSDVYPHECRYCDRKFKRLYSLIVHHRVHTKEKPYECKVCGRAFAQCCDLQKHSRIHKRSGLINS